MPSIMIGSVNILSGLLLGPDYMQPSCTVCLDSGIDIHYDTSLRQKGNNDEGTH